MTILIFTRNKEKIPEFPPRDNLNVRHIVFTSIGLEDLLLIAKHRILKFPTSIILDNKDKVVLRMNSIISEPYIEDVVNNLSK